MSSILPLRSFCRSRGLFVCCLFFCGISPARGGIVSDSVDDWSGNQGQGNWFNGYYNRTADGDQTYGTSDFTQFPGGNGFGPWDGVSQLWTGVEWDANTAAAPPWTSLGQEAVHPNGINSGNEHWPIRRWVSDIDGPAEITWTMRKAVLAGDGVTGLLFVNGVEIQRIAIAGSDLFGVSSSISMTLNSSDLIDLALSPEGIGGGQTDGADRSFNRLTISAVPEPSSFCFFGIASVGMTATWILKRRRKNST